ncbi:hypothetical protein TNCV_4823891 [Trichonephila clavipes]|nr:hypothetical protein TNCV_4823891 [Trichonephila clavipes]
MKFNLALREIGGGMEKGTWLPGVPRSLVQGLDLISLSLRVRVCLNRGVSPFCYMPLYSHILERTLCLVHLITSDWSGTSAELPHNGRCLVYARENSLALPNIYGCNDLSRRGNVRHPLLRNEPFAEELPLSGGERKRIPPN